MGPIKELLQLPEELRMPGRLVTICCDCGAWQEGEGMTCDHCWGDRLGTVTADDEGLAAIQDAWIAGRIEDPIFELAEEALRQAIADTNDEWAPIQEAEAQADPGYIKLTVCEVTYQEARDFVAAHHRHHKSFKFWRFGLGVRDAAGTLRGVVVVGNPVARMIATRCPDTLEVTRCATDGTRNAASMLLGAAWRAVRKIKVDGKPVYRRLISYILESEQGVSYVAAGWARVARVRGKSWNGKTRQRVDKAPTCDKWRYEKVA